MAKRKKGEEPNVLYRVAKFGAAAYGEQVPERAVLALMEISRNLTRIYNDALAERLEAFEIFVAPKLLAIKAAKKEGDSCRIAEIKLLLKRDYKNLPTLFGQINDLPGKRARDPHCARVPSDFQQETLDTLDGAFKSFVSLRAKGDFTARPPKPRREDAFAEILGRKSFAVKGDAFVLRCPNIGDGKPLVFPIPAYQQELLRAARRIKKFTLVRTPRTLSAPGTFSISVAYEIEKPETKFCDPRKIAFLQPGASAIGVVSPAGYEVIEFERPDKYWQPKIDAVNARADGCIKGSNAYRRRHNARHVMYGKRSGQAKLDEREIVQRLIKTHGIHFVVNDLVIRGKKDALADSSNPERGGTLGLNWGVQNTGSIARFLAHLEEKVKERGGSVTKHKLVLRREPPRIGTRVKIWLAKELKWSFLASLRVGNVA